MRNNSFIFIYFLSCIENIVKILTFWAIGVKSLMDSLALLNIAFQSNGITQTFYQVSYMPKSYQPLNTTAPIKAPSVLLLSMSKHLGNDLPSPVSICSDYNFSFWWIRNKQLKQKHLLHFQSMFWSLVFETDNLKHEENLITKDWKHLWPFLLHVSQAQCYGS